MLFVMIRNARGSVYEYKVKTDDADTAIMTALQKYIETRLIFKSSIFPMSKSFWANSLETIAVEDRIELLNCICRVSGLKITKVTTGSKSGRYGEPAAVELDPIESTKTDSPHSVTIYHYDGNDNLKYSFSIKIPSGANTKVVTKTDLVADINYSGFVLDRLEDQDGKVIKFNEENQITLTRQMSAIRLIFVESKVSGTWQFKTGINAPKNAFDEKVNFTFDGAYHRYGLGQWHCSGISFSFEQLPDFALEYQTSSFGYYYIDYDEDDNELRIWDTVNVNGKATVYTRYTGWKTDSTDITGLLEPKFQTITFTEEQNVSEDFYNWLSNNAKKV